MSKEGNTVADMLPGGVSQAQLKQWKNRWGEVTQISVKTDDGRTLYGYFKKPDLETIAASTRFIDTDPVKGGVIVMENCWLGGDEAIKTDDEAKFSVILRVNKLFKVLETEVKKM